MTMPKKGLRKIVVDGQTYNYIIKPMFRRDPHNKRITIELAENEYYSEDIYDSDDPITPAMIEKMIRKNL